MGCASLSFRKRVVTVWYDSVVTCRASCLGDFHVNGTLPDSYFYFGVEIGTLCFLRRPRFSATYVSSVCRYTLLSSRQLCLLSALYV